MRMLRHDAGGGQETTLSVGVALPEVLLPRDRQSTLF